MKPREPRESGQHDMFRSRLDQILDMGHEKVILSDQIDWQFLSDRMGGVYTDGPGHPPLSNRLMAGLHILKYAEDLSDDEVCARWLENPYYQYFCGEEFFCHSLPLDRSSMTRWRQRMGEDRLNALLQESLAVAVKVGAAKPVDFTRAVIDTTVAETLPEFFDAKLARRIREERGGANIVTANNVFAHADDLGEIVGGVRELLADDGVFAFEVSYLRDVYEKTLFDTIYHEHLSYHTVKPLIRFFSSHAMELIAVQLVDTHGGSLRGIAQHQGGARAIDGSVSQFVEEEEKLGLDVQGTFVDFGRRIVALRDELSTLLQGLKSGGSSIAGYGAPAKATTLMYHFGLDAGVIDFIVDDSPLKQGLYSPGLHIPVLPSSALANRNPDYLLILAWNFAEPIMRNNSHFVDQGGRFIVPIPEVKIFPSDQAIH